MASVASIAPQISATTTGKSGTSSSTGVDTKTIADNFQTFLTLLTTQLKNQSPLDPLDTNQFTQQLVQFAQVEQQMKQNDQLATLVKIEQTAQSTTALAFVGATVAVDGQTTALKNGQATWSFNVPKPVTATLAVTNSTGQTVYTGNYTMNPGQQNFVWDGRDSSGNQWPDGSYTLSITGKDASGQTVSIPTEIEGIVDSVDLTQNPPLLSIGGGSYTIDKIKRVVRPTAASSTSAIPAATTSSAADTATAVTNAVVSAIQTLLK
jgi:flagellar basal-body rod modification protein FlgD